NPDRSVAVWLSIIEWAYEICNLRDRFLHRLTEAQQDCPATCNRGSPSKRLVAVQLPQCSLICRSIPTDRSAVPSIECFRKVTDTGPAHPLGIQAATRACRPQPHR